jgi:hypothetical protein
MLSDIRFGVRTRDRETSTGISEDTGLGYVKPFDGELDISRRSSDHLPK